MIVQGSRVKGSRVLSRRLVRVTAAALAALWLVLGVSPAWATGGAATFVQPVTAANYKTFQTRTAVYNAFQGGAKCAGHVRWADGGTGLDVRVQCTLREGATRPLPGPVGGIGAGSVMSVEVTGKQNPPLPVFGSDCGAESTAPIADDVVTLDTTVNVTGSPCHISQVCITLEINRVGMPDVRIGSGAEENADLMPCVTVMLGAYAAPLDPTCSWYSVLSMGINMSGSIVYVQRSVEALETLAAPRGFSAYAMIRKADTSLEHPTGTGAQSGLVQGTTYTGQQLSTSLAAGDEVIGYGIFPVESSGPFNLTAGIVTDVNPLGRYGATDPETCRFYWGEKVGGTASDDTDEPIGPMAGVPDPLPDPDDVDDGDAEDVCGFDLGDPGTWATGALCLLIDAIGRLIGAVLGLPAEIIRLLGGLLEALFIPSEWPAFDEIPSPIPDGWLPEWPDSGGGGGEFVKTGGTSFFTFGSTGSCGPIGLPAGLNFGNLLDGTDAGDAVTLLNTCDDPWPLVRDVTYYGLLAVGMMTLGLRAWGALMSALGMAVESHTSASDGSGGPW